MTIPGTSTAPMPDPGMMDFVPNADCVSPPIAAGFAMVMLGTTAAGDAYTFAEYERLFGEAGYRLLKATRCREHRRR